jgi:hypothetical protein
MKKIVIFFIIILFLFFLAWGALFIFINTKGKDLLIKKIEENLKVEAKIDSLRLQFPFTLEIKKFQCGDLSFKKAKASLGFINPFSYQLNINNLVVEDLNLEIKREKNKVSLIPFFVKDYSKKEIKKDNKEDTQKISVKKESMVSASDDKKTPSLRIKDIRFNNATVVFVDKTYPEVLKYALKDIKMEIKNFNYPKLDKFYINLDASFLASGGKTDNAISINGWIDYFNKDMDCNIYINNIDYTVFSQYYPPRWKPDNLGIKEAILSLNLNANSRKNDMTIKGEILLEKIKYKNLEDTSVIDTLKTILAIVKGDNEKPTLRFELHTKMDSPEFDTSSFRENFKNMAKINIQDMIGKVVDKTKEVVSEGVKGAKEITVDTAIDAVRSLIDAFKGVFSEEETPYDEEK